MRRGGAGPTSEEDKDGRRFYDHSVVKEIAASTGSVHPEGISTDAQPAPARGGTPVTADAAPDGLAEPNTGLGPGADADTSLSGRQPDIAPVESGFNDTIMLAEASETTLRREGRVLHGLHQPGAVRAWEALPRAVRAANPELTPLQ